VSGCCIRIPVPSSGGGAASPLGLEEYVSSQSDSVFASGSAVWVTTGKTLVTPALPAGDYRIGAFYQCSCTILGEGHWRLRLDGISNVWPTDHIQDFGSDDVVFPAYRSRVIALAAGVHTFDLQTQQTGVETTTTRASVLELWRVPPSLVGDNIDPCVCTLQEQQDAYALTTTRQLAGRTFTTPVLTAGTYRIGLSLNYNITSGSSFDHNIRQISSALLYTTDFRGRARGGSGFNGAARYMVREVTLGAGVHQFDLEILSSSTTSVNLGATTWTLHRVP